MSFENRGGGPVIKRLTAANGKAVTTSGVQVDLKTRDGRGPFVCKHLQISNEGANPLKIYFTLADFVADDNDGYIDLPATNGFFEGPVEATTFWLRSVGGNTDTAVIGYVRRG